MSDPATDRAMGGIMDGAALASLIQPQHLEQGALESCRTQFQSSPGRFCVLADLLIDELAGRLSEFLLNEGNFEAEFGLYSAKGHKVDESTWRGAKSDDRFFRYGRLVGTSAEFQFSPNSLAYLRFRNAFQTDDDLRMFFEAATGLELARSEDFGSHSMGAGDFMKDHDDNNRNRRLAIVLYLPPDWSEELGGSLHIVDQSGAESVVAPVYNSGVAFDTLAGTVHFVEPVTKSAEDRRRVTIGGWYHTPGHE
jgi:hypothetical protein